jgi:tRNA (guanine37-N1)-methyltransferase
MQVCSRGLRLLLPPFPSRVYRMSSAASAPYVPTVPPALPLPVIDKSVFEEEVRVVGVRVAARDVERSLRALRPCVLDLPKVKPVVLPPGAAAGDPRRLLLLHRSIQGEGCEGVAEELRSCLRAFLAGAAPAASAAAPAAPPWPLGLQPHTVRLGYEHAGVEAVLRRLLPPALVAASEELPTGFEIVGHVAHMNLREEFLPHRALIGAVVLEKNRGVIRTVVAKLGNIESIYRTFPMEVIAGEPNTRVCVRHSGATFRFDFREVYWNTRLQREHELLVAELLPAGATVADACAGVGPFAVPAALPPRCCTVLANDLNPASVAALRDAIARNRVGALVTPSCMDARAFLAAAAARGVPFTHAIMNLPATALEMCDVFVGLHRRGGGSGGGGGGGGGGLAPPLPRVHMYCFARAINEEGCADDAVARLLKVLGLPACEEGGGGGGGGGGAGGDGRVAGDHLAHVVTPLVRRARRACLPDLLVRVVRNVAPAKLMLCLSFTVPHAVAYAEPVWQWCGEGASGGEEGGGDARAPSPGLQRDAKRARN